MLQKILKFKKWLTLECDDEEGVTVNYYGKKIKMEYINGLDFKVIYDPLNPKIILEINGSGDLTISNNEGE